VLIQVACCGAPYNSTSGAFPMRHAWVLTSALIAGTAAASTNAMMFPIPAGAEKPAHVAMSPGVYEQDYFWIKAEYPATPALSHYEKVFAGWQRCRGKQEGWDGYGDISTAEHRYLHHFVRYWVSPRNDRAVTVLFQYQSKGANYRKRPDNGEQYVAVIQHWTSDAAAWLANIDVQCTKAPNNTVERDARKSGARPSP
jgi:hypothetical protein